MLLLSLISTPDVSADIYMFMDSNGVVHFTNVPTSSDYEVFIKERPKRVRYRRSTSRFDPIIQKAAKKFGIDFSLVKAVIRVESNFSSKAVSKKGAAGLMQIMPDNYKTLYIADPFDPTQNIMGGTRYLRRLMNRYKGKLPLVLAAYNAGPNAVDKHKSIPPYNETRRFVKKVMKFYHIYKN